MLKSPIMIVFLYCAECKYKLLLSISRWSLIVHMLGLYEQLSKPFFFGKVSSTKTSSIFKVFLENSLEGISSLIKTVVSPQIREIRNFVLFF